MFGLSDREFDRGQDDGDSHPEAGAGDVHPADEAQRPAAARLLAARICCLAGILLAIGGMLATLGGATSRTSGGGSGGGVAILG